MSASVPRASRRPRSAAAPAFLAEPPAHYPAFEPHPRAVALLAEVLSRLHDVELPVVQFMAADARSTSSQVARDFAAASVARFGRTLLLSVEPKRKVTPGRSRTARVSAVAGQAMVPDTAIPGLYHRALEDERFEMPALLAQAGNPAGGTKAIRMVVLTSRWPGVAPATLVQAARSHGTVITVAAGLTQLASIQTTARQVQHAGGTVLGTVLFDAPVIRLGLRRWMRRSR